MLLELTSEQNLMRDSLARVLRAPDARAGEDGVWPTTAWRALADGGWLELAATGVVGADLMVMMSAAGEVASTVPLSDGAILPGRLLAAAGREADLADLTSARLRYAAAFEATDDSIVLRAAPHNGGWNLSGAAVSPSAGEADRFVVRATTAAGGTVAFVLDPRHPGVSRETFRSMDGGRGARLTFEDVHLDDGSRLDIDGAAIDAAIAVATGSACAEAAATVAMLVESTRRYAMQRTQFGRPIASFQAIEHKLARMQIAAEEARALACLAAVRLFADVASRALAVSVAKMRIGTLSRFVAQTAVQVHGGMGVSEEMPVAHCFRRLMCFEARLGSTRAHRAALATVVRSAEGLGRSVLDGHAEPRR